MHYTHNFGFQPWQTTARGAEMFHFSINETSEAPHRARLLFSIHIHSDPQNQAAITYGADLEIHINGNLAEHIHIHQENGETHISREINIEFGQGHPLEVRMIASNIWLGGADAHLLNNVYWYGGVTSEWR